MSTIAASVMALLLAMPVSPASFLSYQAPISVSQEQWAPEAADRVLVDTLGNIGYLIHDDGRYLAFPVATGQRRRVYYIGRSYNAATPNWLWKAQGVEVKGDRVTFGKDGRFLRLFEDGERTAYGFHEHRDGVEMLSGTTEERFRSMGCIIVDHGIMDILVATADKNGSVDVLTQYGIDDLQASFATMLRTTQENL